MRLRSWLSEFRDSIAAQWRATSWAGVRTWARGVCQRAAETLSWTLWLFRKTVLVAVAGAVLILLVGNTVFSGDRDVAYRYTAPKADICKQQETAPIVLADEKPERDNNELAAIAAKPDLEAALTCMVQVHQVDAPKARPETGALRYYLSFLEFAESGAPADTDPHDRTLDVRQIDALVAHLREVSKRGKHHYVIAFVHGWRHNAGIGDTDVQNLRLMAAYAASFLHQRCRTIQRDCDTVVTAVYFGWRGARIDERYASRTFGERIGQYLDPVFGTLPALLTLFDRKPVSERIGPSVFTALRRIDAITYVRPTTGFKHDTQSRMITFGHSLGGNMLATALRETMLDRIARHTPGNVMTPPFGDLIVLLNPASEAMNWTELQRAMRQRIRFTFPAREADVPAEIEHDAKEITDGHKFYPMNQPPVYMTLGSANTWPAGGIRKADIKYLHKQVFGDPSGPTAQAPYGVAAAKEETAAYKACRDMLRRREVLDRPHYDWATHDLFPAFRFDFRPAADTLEEISKGNVSEDICNLDTPNYDPGDEEQARGWLTLATGFLRNFPFMNTDVEQTRTIGNLIPTRSPIGSLDNGAILPATVYGTTHELMFNLGKVEDDFTPASYRFASDLDYTECAVTDNWLWRARNRVMNAMAWDSGYTADSFVQNDPPNVTPLRDKPAIGGGRLESRFRHGLAHSGMAPIVRGNDPFWNVRVFETGMRDHDGYTSYPLICAISQLVMDKIAEPVPPPAAPAPPGEPGSFLPASSLSVPAVPLGSHAVEAPAKAP